MKNLQLKWVYHPDLHEERKNQSKMENTPIVVDGIMYTGTALEAVALDAVTGRRSGSFRTRSIPRPITTPTKSTRAWPSPGDTLFWATVDCHLLAIDTKTGRVIWDKVMAEWQKGYQFNVAPLVVRNMVILGPATNEAGANCWVAAYDVKTGKELWRFDTAPISADQPEAKTWAGDSWKHGGSPIWNGGAYDPETNLTFWGTGNPNPGWNGDPRTPGDNLYSDSVIALDADTGKLKWYYQFTPGDEYDWDATQVPVLATMDWKGQPRKVMLWANRNGFFYVLDRTSGQFLMGKNFVKQNWNVGFDEAGRPIKVLALWPKPNRAHLCGAWHRRVARTGIRRRYSPHTGLFYISGVGDYSGHVGEGRSGPLGGRPAVYRQRHRPRRTTGRAGRAVAAGGARTGNSRYRTEEEGYGAIRALDPKTGEKKWDFKMADYTETGVLSTARRPGLRRRDGRDLRGA